LQPEEWSRAILESTTKDGKVYRPGIVAPPTSPRGSDDSDEKEDNGKGE